MVIMTLNVLFIVSSIVILVPAILIVSYKRFMEYKLLQLFEYDVNRSLCMLHLENYSCNTLQFQLDYKRHYNSNYIPMVILIMMRLFDYWTNQQKVKIFFGSIKLNNIVRRVVAKSPKDNCSEMFKEILKNLEIDITINNNWILELNSNNCNLVICSKNNTNSYLLLNNFFNSVIGKKSDISRIWVESLVADHLNVELLVLQVSVNLLF